MATQRNVDILIRARDEASRKFERLQHQLHSVGNQMTATGRRMMAGGAVIGAAMAGMVRTFARVGDRFDKLNQQTQIAVERLSAMEFAARRSGTSLDSIDRAMGRMTTSIHNLRRGLSSSEQAFEILGLRLEDIEGLGIERQFAEIAARIREIEDPSKRMAVASELLGQRSARALIPLISHYDDLIEKAEEGGFIIETKTARAAAVLTDTLGDLRLMMRNTGVTIGAQLAPALVNAGGRATELISEFRQWMAENPQWVIKTGMLAAGLFGVGSAAVAAGLSIKALAFAMGGLVMPLKAVVGLAGVLKGLFGWKILALGAIAAGIAKLGGSFEWLGGVMRTASDYFRDFLGYLAKAFAVGDFKAAWDLFANSAEIAFTNIKIGWVGVTHHLKESLDQSLHGWKLIVDHFTLYIMKTGEVISTGWSGAWDDAWWRMSRRLAWIAERVPGLGELIAPGVEDFDALNKMLDEYHSAQMAEIDPMYEHRMEMLEKEFKEHEQKFLELWEKKKQAEQDAHEERVKQLLKERAEAEESLNAVKAALDAMEMPDFAKPEGIQAAFQRMLDDLDSAQIPGMGAARRTGVSPVESRFLQYAPGTRFGTAEERTARSTEQMAKQIPNYLKSLIRPTQKTAELLEQFRYGPTMAAANLQ